MIVKRFIKQWIFHCTPASSSTAAAARAVGVVECGRWVHRVFVRLSQKLD